MSLTIQYPACALVMLVGPSGAGKSTFASRHFTPTQVLSSDQCRRMIIDDEASQFVNEDAFALLHQWLELRLKHRRFTVVDSTALKPGSRDNLLAVAKKHEVPVFALALDVPEEECVRRDAARSDRQVGEKVVHRHHAQFANARREIEKDDRLAGYHILTMEQIDKVQIVRGTPATEVTQFDVIGDVHGCWEELRELWELLGYQWNEDGLPVHPEGRLPVFVGDLADRGPDSARVLRVGATLVARGLALFAPGNHDDKLFRMLKGRNVQRSHGLDLTEAQINALPKGERATLVDDILRHLSSTPSHLVLDGGALVVAHAGIKEEMIGNTGGHVREMTLYGDVRGFEPGTNKPIRHDWAQDYKGKALIAYGHTPQEEICFVNNTVNLDGGCVFGGKLCALRYPEREIICVPAHKVYAYHEALSFSHPV